MNRFQFLPWNSDTIILNPFYHKDPPPKILRAASTILQKKERRGYPKQEDSTPPSIKPRVSFSNCTKSSVNSSQKKSKAETEMTRHSSTKLSKPTESQRHRDWSRDPAKCPNSNWTIHVCRRNPTKKKWSRGDSWDANSRNTTRYDDEQQDSYYIDTAALDKLPADRIPLFEQIFMECLEETGNNQSRIVIEDEMAARAFGILLDFLYAKNYDEEVALLSNVQRGQALYRIADYFKVQPLKERVAQFYEAATQGIVSSVTPAESPKGRKLSKNSSWGSLVSSASRKDMKKRSRMETWARDVHTMDCAEQEVLEAETLLDVLKQRKAMGLSFSKVDSENISCLVAVSVESNRDKISREMFYNLTSPEYIPHIDQEAALQFLTVEQEKGFWKDRDNFSSVQSRCIRSLLADWEGLRRKFHSDELYWRALKKLSPSILGILLMHASKTTQGDEDLSSITDGAASERFSLYYE